MFDLSKMTFVDFSHFDLRKRKILWVWGIGHFRVAVNLIMKMKLSAKLFI